MYSYLLLAGWLLLFLLKMFGLTKKKNNFWWGFSLAKGSLSTATHTYICIQRSDDRNPKITLFHKMITFSLTETLINPFWAYTRATAHYIHANVRTIFYAHSHISLIHCRLSSTKWVFSQSDGCRPIHAFHSPISRSSATAQLHRASFSVGDGVIIHLVYFTSLKNFFVYFCSFSFVNSVGNLSLSTYLLVYVRIIAVLQWKYKNHKKAKVRSDHSNNSYRFNSIWRHRQRNQMNRKKYRKMMCPTTLHELWENVI